MKKAGIVILIIMAAVGASMYSSYQEYKERLAAASRQTANNQSTTDNYQSSTTTNKAKAWPMLKEGQTEQEIANDLLAKNYYFVVDGSGSMDHSDCSGGLSKMQAAKNALVEFARNIPADANVGVVAFDRNGISERMPMQLKNETAFNDAVQGVYQGSGTPLHSSIDIAFNKITEQGRKQLGYGEYNIIIVTDGAASSGEDPTNLVNEIINNSPVLIHTIGFCLDDNHSLNQEGRTYYKAADNIESMRQGLDDILAESEQFTVTDFQ